jgi:hypothetical protein
MSSLTLQHIFQNHFWHYRENHKVPAHQLRVAQKIMRCRTASNGVHIRKCVDNHTIDIWYNSCKHRACPQCSSIDIENWLELQKSKLVKCPHYHVIITLSNDLNGLWAYNSGKFADMFFTAVKESIFEILANAKYLGAKPGLLACLQTWGSNLSLHPHLHCLVTAGGVNETGEWVNLRNPNFLMPGRLAAAIFRGKMLSSLCRAVRDGSFHLPADTDKKEVLSLLKKLWGQEWNVHICEKYAYGDGVVSYLARYVKGGAIANDRLVRDDAKGVLFKYTNYRDEESPKKNQDDILLSHDEFIRRILLHIPDLRLRTFRSYGIYRRNIEELNRVREHFGQAPVQESERLLFEAYLTKKGFQRDFRCPICGGPVAILEKHYGSRVFTTIVTAAQAA